jgi:hypothetical protein
MTAPVSYDVVVPTVLRPSLDRLVESLASGRGPLPDRVLVVVDGDGARMPARPEPLAERLVVMRSPGRGPAAARNAGWRAATSDWVVFLDDDVVPQHDWRERLVGDLARLPAHVAASQGGVRVPLPASRRPTDCERNVRGLEEARWATADMAVRRGGLAAAGGFDERFARAYREDSDLGLRLARAGLGIVEGDRVVEHPPAPSRLWSSVRRQAGNADDALMRALHGPGWRQAAGAPKGRRTRHLAIAVAAAVTGLSVARGAAKPAGAAAALWFLGTAELAWARIAPGPRDRAEIGRMLVTSVALPLVATVWWLIGWARVPWLLARGGPRPEPPGLEAVA